MKYLGPLGKTLLAAERESREAAGLLQLLVEDDPEPVGSLMMEKGRVCWAASRLNKTRLTDVLVANSRCSRQELEKIFEHCRESGHPLGEYLVSREVLTAEQFRGALRYQIVSTLASATSMGLLLDSGQRFVAAQQTSYQPTFTFTGGELMAEAVGQSVDCALEAGPPPPTYTKLADQFPAAVCFWETGEREVPAVPIHYIGFRDLPLEEALVFYSTGRTMAQPAALRAAGVDPFATLMHHEGHGWLAAYHHPHLCLFKVDDRTSTVRLLSSLLSQEL